MNKIYKHCLIILVFVLGSSRVFATHIEGMDLTFTCKGNNTYTFTLNFYRDCLGIAPIIKPLYIQSASNNYSTSITLTQVGNPKDISPLCAKDTNNSTCHGGTLPGSQVWVYQGTFTLPYYATDWVFYYDDEARNPAITNLINPGNDGIEIKDSLDNSSGLCVNSPIFSTPPVPYVCDGDPFTYNHGGYDADGDSLVYKLVAPLDDNTGLGVVYIPGLSYDSPLVEKQGVPYALDSITGQITATPQPGLQQITVTAVRIFVYKDKKLIGYVTRDIEIIVLSCTNTPPYGSGIQNLVGGALTGPTSFTLCANTNTSFQITAKDSDINPIQAITVTTNANLVLPGAVVTVTDTNPAYVNITWLPTEKDTGFHNFTISMKDNNCPIYGISVYSYQIYVSPSTKAEGDTFLCGGEATTLSVTGGRHFVWTPSTGLSYPDSSTTLATPTITTTYIVTSNLTAACKNKDTVVVKVNLPFTIDISANGGQICPGTLTPLNAAIIGGSPGGYTYSWRSSPPGFSSTSASISDTPKVPTTYYVVAKNGPCSDSSSFTLNVDTTANANFAISDTLCASQQYNIVYTGHSPSNSTFKWSFSGGIIIDSTLDQRSYHVDYPDPGGPYIMSLSVTNNPDGCSAFESRNIYVGTPFTVSTTADPVICRLSSTTLVPAITGGGNNGTYTYTWTSNPAGFSSDSTNPVVSPVVNTTYHVLAYSLGCSDTSSFVVAVDSNALATFNATDTICQDEPFTITFQGYSQFAASYTWNYGGGTVISGSGEGPITLSYPTPGIHTVSLLIKNPDGCTDSSSTNVFVATPFKANITGDTVICPTTSASLSALATGGNDGPYTYTWRSNPSGFASSSSSNVVSPVVSTTYYVVLHSKTGCDDSAAIAVRIDSAANAKFTVTDSTCVNQQLFANYTGTSPKNSQYTWTFNGANVINGAGSGPYVLQYSKSGTYRVTLHVTDSVGCSDTSSTDIVIIALPQDTFSAEPRIGCEPSTVSFSINSTKGSTYSWSFGDGTGSTQQNPTHTYKHGIYTVTLTVTDPHGCLQTYTATNYITVDTSVIAAFTVDADTAIFYNFKSNTFQFTNQSKYAVSYTWYFGDGTSSTDANPTHTYPKIGDYYVELVACDSLGCCDTSTFGPIHIRNLSDFYLPGAFTPGNETNNHFHIIGIYLSNPSLKVYNRWGELIWQGTGANATDANLGWDGTYKGKPQPMDVYVWYATATLANGQVVTKKGNVTLIR